MTLYADTDLRKAWRYSYGILKLESAPVAADYWERHGGAPSGCILALAHAIEQIEADEALLRQALEALYACDDGNWVDVVNALRERLE